MSQSEALHSPLGKKSNYVSHYQPDLLFPIARKVNREAIGVTANLPFQGQDIWNAFELSWLNPKGKPVVAALELVIPCESEYIVESKSMKLYFNSLNDTVFDSFAAVEKTLVNDLTRALGMPLTLKLSPLTSVETKINRQLSGKCIDELDITCDTYTITPTYLTTENHRVTEILYSDLLKSNCLVTGQPDWGSIQVSYTGKKIHEAGLLQYVVSFRHVNEFAEQCVERIFMDISQHCQPEKLCVYARYTRRGGIDINPYRANYPLSLENNRLWRQ